MAANLIMSITLSFLKESVNVYFVALSRENVHNSHINEERKLDNNEYQVVKV